MPAARPGPVEADLQTILRPVAHPAAGCQLHLSDTGGLHRLRFLHPAAIRKEILQQIAEQRHMTVAAVNSGLRRLIDSLETRQPAAWRSFKEKYHLDETNVTTGKLIYALKRAVEQDR